jgi:zinc transport system permease protein
MEPSPTWSDFVAGWQLGLYRDPVICGMIAGLLLGLLGVFVVLRRAVFATAVVSQGAALGVALAFFCQIHVVLAVPPLLGAFVVSTLALGVLFAATDRLGAPPEGLLGVAYVAASAGAVLAGDRISQESHDIASILFGTAVLIRPEDLAWVAAVAIVVIATLLVGYRGFVFAGFDRDGARVQGLPVRLIEGVLWALLAAAVAVTTRAIGALPVLAFAILPPLSGLALFERLPWVLAAAAGIGAVSGGVG